MSESIPLSAEEIGIAPSIPDRMFFTKVQLYNRLSDAELATFDGYMRNVATVRQRRQWDDAQEIDPDYPGLKELTIAMFGEARSAEIWAPNPDLLPAGT